MIPQVSFQDLVKEVKERHISTGAPLTLLVGEALARCGTADPEAKCKLLSAVVGEVPSWKQVRRGLVEERRGRSGVVYRAENGFQPERDD